MEAILTLDIGSTSMRAVHHDLAGKPLCTYRRSTVPTYRESGVVELDCTKLVGDLLSLLKESATYCKEHSILLLAISVTAQRSSVVPVNGKGEPLAPFIMWHDKRTIPLCLELSPDQDWVYDRTGLRISPVLSAVKMSWIRRNMVGVYANTAKLLGIQDVVIHALTGLFVTDESLASNTTLLNLHSRDWDRDLLEFFSVRREHLCDLVSPGSVCGKTTDKLQKLTGISGGTPVVTAGGDQQSAALGLGIISPGKLKCTTGTGSYLVAYSDSPVFDEKKRFLCKIGAIPGSYNIEAGMLTSGAVYRWFIQQFFGDGSDLANVAECNEEVSASPAGAGGVTLLPHFEGSGAPHWNPEDCGVFHGLKLSSTRGDMARAVLEGIVMEMNENISLFRQKVGPVEEIYVSGGMTAFDVYNQLQADIFGSEVILHSNRESASLGAWISATVAIGVCTSYEEALSILKRPETERRFSPVPAMTEVYSGLIRKRRQLYQALQSIPKVD